MNGQHILGMTPQQVEAALGKPTVIRGNAQTTNGVPIPEFRYGGSLPSTLGLSVGFSKKGDRIFANSLSYQSPSLVDAKLGHVLRMQPAELQQAITRTYGTTLHVFIGYGSNPGVRLHRRSQGTKRSKRDQHRPQPVPPIAAVSRHPRERVRVTAVANEVPGPYAPGGEVPQRAQTVSVLPPSDDLTSRHSCAHAAICSSIASLSSSASNRSCFSPHQHEYAWCQAVRPFIGEIGIWTLIGEA